MDQSAVDWVPTLVIGSTSLKSNGDVVENIMVENPIVINSFDHGANAVTNGIPF